MKNISISKKEDKWVNCNHLQSVNKSDKRCVITILLVFLFFFSFSQYASAEEEIRQKYEEEFLFFGEEEFTTIASFRNEPIPRAPGIITVLTSSTISKMPARFLTDVLKSMPGLDVRYSNFGEFFVSFRGNDDPTNVLVMVNGKRFNDPFSGRAPFDIPVDGISKIEIIRGPGSALYGNNALVGVINISTVREEGMSVKVGAGSFDTKKANIKFGHKGRTDIYGFFEFYDTVGGDAEIMADKLSITAPYLYSMTPARQKDDKEKMQGSIDLNYEGYEIGLFYYKENRGPNVAYLDIYSDQSRIKSDFNTTNIKKTYYISDRIEITPSIYISNWQWDYKIQLYPNGYVDSRDLDGDGNIETFKNGEWLFKSYETSTYGAEVRLDNEIAETNSITGGISIETSYVKNTNVATNYRGEPDKGAVFMSEFSNWNDYEFPENNRDIYAIYLQDIWSPNKYTSFIIGGRYDNYSDFGETANPRIAANFYPSENVDIKFQYATAFEAPTFRELYDKTDVHALGNPHLKPEKVKTVELGLGYTYQENSFVRINGFMNSIKDEIVPIYNLTRVGESAFQNAGQYQVNGIEIDSRKTFTDRSYLVANATLFNAKDEISGTWLTMIPQFRANIGINKTLPRESTISLFWLYSDVSNSNIKTSQDRLPQNSAQTGPFHLVNSAIGVNNLYGGISLKISVFNIMNIDYRELYTGVRYRLPRTDQAEPGKNLIQSNQRMYLFEVGKEF